MKGYFESQIQSGDVNKLICPYEKCESQALQAQVTQVKVSKLYNSSYHFFLVILTKKGSEFSGSRFVQ